MTNLQQSAPLLSPRVLRRLWFGLPLAAGSLLSVVVAAGVLVPQWRSLQADSQRLQELEDLQSQVLLMRQQLRTQDIQEETALRRKDKLFRLIAGGGDVSTVLAVLDREARATGVRLDLFEPQAAAVAPPPAAGTPPAAAPAPPPLSPLQQAGLRPYTMVIAAQATYPQLLAFQRRLESLNLLVIQNNVKLELPAQATGPSPAQAVTMKFSITLYGQASALAAAAAPSAPARGNSARELPNPAAAPATGGTPPPVAQPTPPSVSSPAPTPAPPPATPTPATSTPAGATAPARP